MRQALTVLLVLLFGLGPLTAALPGSDQARLPACCRRKGAHHCTMARMALPTQAGAAFSAPAHCPMYPGPAAALLSTAYAMLAAPGAQPDAVSRVAHNPSPLTAMLSNRGRTAADRGPPAGLSL
jgi:hypothetical protein